MNMELREVDCCYNCKYCIEDVIYSNDVWKGTDYYCSFFATNDDDLEETKASNMCNFHKRRDRIVPERKNNV